MALPQHSTSPSPGLMQSTSLPQFSHWNRFPSWLAIPSPYFCSMGWPQQESEPSPAFVTIISLPHFEQP